MLPCQTDCPHYCQGCHKTCASWRVLQQRQHEDQQRKKEYLRRATPDGALNHIAAGRWTARGDKGAVRRFFMPKTLCSAGPDVV